MKTLKLTSSASLIASLMLVSTQQIAGVVENSQIMPPPGPYKSIMNNMPPAFVPYGSKQAQVNPLQQRQLQQPYNNFPADTHALYQPATQAPEWVLTQQKQTRDNIEKMLKENEKRNMENEKRYAEYLNKSEELAAQREIRNRKWLEENNKQMKKTWKNMLDEYSKYQKQQIMKAENIPQWVKDRMLKEHENQLSMMNSNPPMAMNNMRNQINVPMNRNTNMNPANINLQNPNFSAHTFRPDMPQPGQFNAPPLHTDQRNLNPQQMRQATGINPNINHNYNPNYNPNYNQGSPVPQNYRQNRPQQYMSQPYMGRDFPAPYNNYPRR